MAKKKDSQGFSEEEKLEAYHKQFGQCIGCWDTFPFEEMENDDSNEKVGAFPEPRMVCKECNRNKDGDWKTQTMHLDAYSKGLKSTDTEDE